MFQRQIISSLSTAGFILHLSSKSCRLPLTDAVKAVCWLNGFTALSFDWSWEGHVQAGAPGPQTPVDAKAIAFGAPGVRQ